MKDYENQAVEIEGQAAAGESEQAEEDFFEDIEKIDEEDVAHH